MLAAMHGKIACVQKLIQAGANVRSNNIQFNGFFFFFLRLRILFLVLRFNEILFYDE